MQVGNISQNPSIMTHPLFGGCAVGFTSLVCLPYTRPTNDSSSVRLSIASALPITAREHDAGQATTRSS